MSGVPPYASNAALRLKVPKGLEADHCIAEQGGRGPTGGNSYGGRRLVQPEAAASGCFRVTSGSGLRKAQDRTLGARRRGFAPKPMIVSTSGRVRRGGSRCPVRRENRSSAGRDGPRARSARAARRDVPIDRKALGHLDAPPPEAADEDVRFPDDRPPPPQRRHDLSEHRSNRPRLPASTLLSIVRRNKRRKASRLIGAPKEHGQRAPSAPEAGSRLAGRHPHGHPRPD